ncbi:hypothetical protein FPQ18DRAFT_419168 [Pyronema domesticum]|nr:hypothetical protein FPQ18DRAFT_419168 [Pyronema domesticum]
MKPTIIMILTSATLAVGNVVHIKPDTSLSAPDAVTTRSTVNPHDFSPDQASGIDYAEILGDSSSSDFAESAEDSSKRFQKYKEAEYNNPHDEYGEQDDDHQNHPRGGGGGGDNRHFLPGWYQFSYLSSYSALCGGCGCSRGWRGGGWYALSSGSYGGIMCHIFSYDPSQKSHTSATPKLTQQPVHQFPTPTMNLTPLLLLSISTMLTTGFTLPHRHLIPKSLPAISPPWSPLSTPPQDFEAAERYPNRESSDSTKVLPDENP